MKTKRIPLLKDHHNHLSTYSLFNHCLNLQEILDKEEALTKLSSLAKEELSVVLGWNNSYYDFSQSQLAKLPPLIIVNLSIHSFLMTPSAEEKLKGRFPEVVAKYRDPLWYEQNFPQMVIFLAGLMRPTQSKLKGFFDQMYSKGVYFVEDMLVTSEKMIEVIHASPYSTRTELWADPKTYRSLKSSNQKKVKGIKLFTDGALGSKTAATVRPYRDGSTSQLLSTNRALTEILQKEIKNDKPLAIHAIGDAATFQVIDILVQLDRSGIALPAIRLEHCQFIDKETALQAKELGVILSMQPNFNLDSHYYQDRLSSYYLELNNPFRMLIDEVGFLPGKDLLFGSDGMPHGASAALQTSLFPPNPQQQLTLGEFVAGYCMPDESTGSIEVGIEVESGKIDLTLPD